MIHFFSVGKFVYHNIIQDFFRGEDQPPVEVQVSFAGAAAQAASERIIIRVRSSAITFFIFSSLRFVFYYLLQSGLQSHYVHSSIYMQSINAHIRKKHVYFGKITSCSVKTAAFIRRIVHYFLHFQIKPCCFHIKNYHI